MRIVLGLALLAALIIVYLLPTIIAFNRDVPHKGSVAVIDILLGWSLIGWVVALAMAVRSIPGQTKPRWDLPGQPMSPPPPSKDPPG